MLVRNHDGVKFKDVVEAIFMADNRDDANAIIKEYDKFWMAIPGTRGAIGKKTQNASTYYKANYQEVSVDTIINEDELAVWEKPKEQYAPILSESLWHEQD